MVRGNRLVVAVVGDPDGGEFEIREEGDIRNTIDATKLLPRPWGSTSTGQS